LQEEEWEMPGAAMELQVQIVESLVVDANAITRTERDDKTGEDVELKIPYMKGYTVFNLEQIEGLPEIY